MKVVVTGASGFIGSAVALDLAARGHEVGVLLREGSNTWRIGNAIEGMRRLEADLSRSAEVAAAVRDFAPEAVAHLAWSGVANHDRNDWRQARNVTQAAALLEAAVAAGAKHFVACGSQAEYGPRTERIVESVPLRPTTAYGGAKVATFHLLQPLCAVHGMRFAWARFFSTYGPRDEPHWMIPQLIGRLLRGERPALTEGIQRWDYLHVSDAAHAITRLVETPAATGAFNVGSGSPVTVRRIAEMIRDHAAPGAPLGFGEVPYRPDQVMHLEADIARLRAATGWAPRIGIEDGLRETVAWLREHAQAHDHAH